MSVKDFHLFFPPVTHIISGLFSICSLKQRQLKPLRSASFEQQRSAVLLAAEANPEDKATIFLQLYKLRRSPAYLANMQITLT